MSLPGFLDFGTKCPEVIVLIDRMSAICYYDTKTPLDCEETIMRKWTAPLPNHTKLDYYECYAKIALSQLLSRNYKNLIVKDKPDLQFSDGSSGIEVTQAIDPAQQRAERLYTEIVYGLVRSKEGALQEIRNCGCKYENGILMGKTGTDSFNLILQAIKAKLEKINKGGYDYFHHYDLFVFSDIYDDDIMLKNALSSMLALSGKYNLFFEKIWVLVPGSLYVFDLLLEQTQVIDCSSELQYEIACQAREMVEAAEKIEK